MTNYQRLILELNNKNYLTASAYAEILEENSLYPEKTFSAQNDLINLKRATLAIMQILGNDIGAFCKIESEFLTQSAAYEYIGKRIKDLEAEIKRLKTEQRTNSADKDCPRVTHLFYDRLETEE